MNRNKNVKVEIKDFKGTLIKLVKFCSSYKLSIVIAIVLSIGASICAIIGPNKLQDLTNLITRGILTGIDIDGIKKIFITLLIIYVLSSLFNYIQGFIMTVVANKISKKLRSEISLKINRLPLRYFDKTSYGDILSKVTNDVSMIGNNLSDTVSTLFSSVVLLIGVVIMMFVTNYVMAITAILSTIIGFSLMTLILKNSQKYFMMQQKELGNLNGHIEEVYSGHNIVKVYNATDDVNKKFKSINDKLYKSSRKSYFLSSLMPQIMNFNGNFSYLCICIIGASLVINGSITMGTIVAFMIYTRLFTSPLINISNVFMSLQTLVAAGERVFTFLEEEEMELEKNTKKLNKKSAKGNIVFKDVYFSYDKEPIIKGFSANIKKGQKIAIVGPTGAGKTTIVNLLMKFYDINSGDIIIDGISIKDISRKNIHDLFVMVLQDTWIFNGTIYDNIVYNNKNISLDEVKDVCEKVGLDHYIKTLTDNYNTTIDEDYLSAGEKQLLTIARAMLKDSPFLILDEATSNVDTRTEELVQIAMDKLMKGKTSFIIAHRLSTIKNADLILVLKDGNIIEQGTHEELLSFGGFYEELYNSQFEEV